MKIEKFTHGNIDPVIGRINQLLEPLKSEYGITADTSNIRYDESSFSTKLTILIGSGDGKLTRLKTEFNKYCWLFDLTPEDWGCKFKHNNKLYTLVGLKPSSPVYPILGEDANGKVYKFRTDTLKSKI